METIEGRNLAVQAVTDWLGDEKAELIANAIKSGEIENMACLRLVMSFAGLHGAPVVAFGERHGLYDHKG